ncbi:MAG: CapA family protein [Prevotella fusca]|uniref:CapA family protein n=1 Tax=Prevotella fusca TaxID=589436 RepID=UPI003FA18085
MMKKHSIAQAVKAILCLSTPILLSFSGIGVDCTGKQITVSKVADDTLHIVVTGDLLLDRGVRQKIDMAGVDSLFTSAIDSVFLSSDFVIANLECPVTKIRERVFKRFIFRGEPEWLPTLRRHGITHLNLANNHSIDQGRSGLLDTQEQVKKAGMIPVGAGRNMEEAAEPILISTTPRHIWLIPSLRLPLENFPYLPKKPCVNQENIDSLTVRVTRLRAADARCYILILLHWGWEHHLKATPQQREDARRLIDAGADAIIGHHSHTLQTIETYRGKPIYYGIGNFIFDQRKPANTRACIVKLSITQKDCKTTALPIEIRNCVPHLSKMQF